jgi:hypothetical protein
MKRCPTCQRIYADDTLNFCLEDGAPLINERVATLDETLTLDASEPPPTEILPHGLAPTQRAHKPPTTVRQEARRTQDDLQNLATPTLKQRNTTSVVALTVIGTILLLALGGLGAWLLLKDKSEGANINGANTGTTSSRDGNSNTMPTNGNLPGSTNTSKNTQPGASPTATPLATPLATATPGSGTSSTDAATVRREVSNALNGWRQTMINPDVDAHMSYYADTLHTYYNASNVNVSRVRANVARAFSSYNTFDVRITNLQIEVDPAGEKAIATFDKTFEFRNAEKRYAGSGLNRFWLEKIGGRWLITGEKDLKTYY